MARVKTEWSETARLPGLVDVLELDALVALARRCGLEVDGAQVVRLQEAGVLVGRAPGAGYGPLHLWVLVRYLEAVSVAHHASGPDGEALARVPARLEAVSRLGEAVGRVWCAADVVARAKVTDELEDWLGEHDGLRSLRGMLQWVRPEVLAELRGAALLWTLLRQCAAELRDGVEIEVSGPASAAPIEPVVPAEPVAASVEDAEPEVEEPGLAESTERTTQRLPAMGGIRPVGARTPAQSAAPGAMVASSSPSPLPSPPPRAGSIRSLPSPPPRGEVAPKVAGSSTSGVAPRPLPGIPKPPPLPAASSGESPSLGSAPRPPAVSVPASSTAPASTAPPTVSAPVPAVPLAAPSSPGVESTPRGGEVEEPPLARSAPSGEVEGRTSGIRAALQRPGTPPSNPAMRARADEPTPEAELPRPVAEVAAPSSPSLKEKVIELNRKRQEYIANNEWQKLVELYRDGLHLFSDPLERRQVLLNIGAISEQQLGRTDAAIAAFEEALAIKADSPVFNALYRLYEKARRRDDLMHCIERLLDAHAEEPWTFEARVRQAELLVTELGREEEALTVLQEVLSSELTREDREWTLDVLIGLLDAPGRRARFLLDGTSLLEAHWSMGTYWQQMVELYERVFQILAEQDLNVEAAEALSRMAAICQANDRYERAFDALTRSLPFHPTLRDTHRRLLRLAKKIGALDRLVVVYEEELEGTLDEEVRAALGVALANVHEAAGDQDGVREALRIVAEADPSNTEVLMRLAQLETASGKLEALDLLRHHLSGDEKLEANLKVARLRFEGLFDDATSAQRVAVDVDTAIDALQDVLSQAPPSHPQSAVAVALGREVIRSDQQPAALQVAEMLEFYHRTHQDDEGLQVTWGVMLEVLERSSFHRVEAATLLGRMAAQREEKGRAREAFELLCRALRTDSEQPEFFGKLLRLAEGGGWWRELGEAVDVVLGDPLIPHRETWLRQSAELRRDRLSDAEGALARYEELLELVPGDAEALEFLERHHEGKGGEGFVEAIDRKAAGLGEDERRALWWSAALRSATELGDPASAGEFLARLVPFDDKPGATVSRLASSLGGRLEGLEAILAETAKRVQDPRQATDLLLRRAKLLASDPARRAEAAEVYEQVLDASDVDSPVSASVLPRLSDLYAVLGDKARCYQTLERQFEVLASRKLRSGRTREEMAQLLDRLATMAEQELSDPDGAVRHLEALIELNPEERSALGKLRRLYEAGGDHDGVFRVAMAMSRASASTGDRSTAITLAEPLAEMARQKLRDPARELEALRLLDELGADVTHTTWGRMASLALQSGSPTEALDVWERAVTMASEGSEKSGYLRTMSQVARRQLHDEGAARDYLERARNLDPGNVQIVHDLAELYQAGRMWREVTQLWMHTIDTNDQLGVGEAMEMCRALARVLDEELGERRQAAGKLELALILASDGEAGVWTSLRDRVRRELIDLYHRLGEEAAALTHLQEVEKTLRSARGDRTALALLYEEMGRAALSSGQPDAAERYFLQATEENSGSGSARLGLAEVYLGVERWSEALELLTFLVQRLELLHTDEQRGRVYAGLGRVYSATGKVAKAVEMYKVALQHDPGNKHAVEAMR